MVHKCDECATPLILGEGFLVCPGCGLVHERPFQRETPMPAMKQRLGSLMGRGVGQTWIGTCNNERFYAKYRRLGDLQEAIYRGYYVDIFRLTSDLQKIAQDLSLPSEVVESTMRLFQCITSKVRNPYNNRGLLLAVCLTAVTREMGRKAPVKISEVADAFTEMGYRISPRLLARTLCSASNIMPVRKFRNCEEYVGKVLSILLDSPFLKVRADALKLNLSEYLSDLERVSADLLTGIPPVKRSGKNPFLLAASSVYASSKLVSRWRGITPLFTKTEFSKEVGIAEYTLRSHLAEVFNRELKENVPIPYLATNG